MPEERLSPQILLSVVVPVYNQAGSIAENVRIIRGRVAAGLPGATEVIVVSDGSIDDTQERALAVSDDRTRVLHYDRNMGKGYAVKMGALEARGRWVAYVDADLDLDPALLPAYLARAEAANLDFAIGSKRHAGSNVFYPRSRRASSRLFQLLVRILFRLDVRDTQVGIKLFSRDVAEQVLPLLIVKRFAFDIELLAVARAVGLGRIEEQPIRLDYRFTGSGVRSAAVARALVDVAAIFYRLRVLRYYQRKQRRFGRFGFTRPRGRLPTVAVRGAEHVHSELDYPALVSGESPDADLVALLRPGAVPAGNWLSATVPFLIRPEVGAVVTPSVAPPGGPLLARAAAAVRESRLGGGSQYYRYMPGNLREVDDFPADGIVVRASVLSKLDPGLPRERVAEAVAEAGYQVLYTPESVVVAPAPLLLRPHLLRVHEDGRGTGRVVRRRGVRAVRPTTAALMLGVGWLAFGWLASEPLWAVAVAAYGLALVSSGLVAGVRWHSVAVAVLAAVALPATHLAYVLGVLRGLGRR